MQIDFDLLVILSGTNCSMLFTACYKSQVCNFSNAITIFFSVFFAKF